MFNKMPNKLHIKKGDQVIVISGESKGTGGRVLAVDHQKNVAFVEGANMIHRHTKPDAKTPHGRIVKKEAPIHLSNLMLIDPKSGKPGKIGRKLSKDGKLVRYSKKSGELFK